MLKALKKRMGAINDRSVDNKNPQRAATTGSITENKTNYVTTPTSAKGNTKTTVAPTRQSAQSRIHSIVSNGARTIAKNSRRSSKDQDMLLPELPDLSSMVSYLKDFDSCIDMADGLTANCGQMQEEEQKFQNHIKDSALDSLANDKQPLVERKLQRRGRQRLDPTSGLPDCSVLISAEGKLLAFPNNTDESKEKNSSTDGTLQIEEQKGITRKDEPGEEQTKIDETAHELFEPTSAIQKDDVDHCRKDEEENSHSHSQNDDAVYESAIYLGHDLHPSGDKAFNGFSAKGWSSKATSTAIQQTEQALDHLSRFCEELILTKKESTARTSAACDILGNNRLLQNYENSDDLDWEIIDPRSGNFQTNPERVGPLLHPQSTLHAAVVALEKYHIVTAENEAENLRIASRQREAGVLPQMHRAAEQISSRATKRQQALEETSRRAKMVQDRLEQLQIRADAKWRAVQQMEDMATQQLEDIREKRNKERELQRMLELQKEEEKQALDSNKANLGATDQEIWSMVSAATAGMNGGSFEPMDFPSASLTLPHDKSADSKKNGCISERTKTDSAGSSCRPDRDSTSSLNTIPSESLPLASREEVEYKIGLPSLRMEARAADEQVEDASAALLNMLSSLDTAKRSARVAAETLLLSACHAQTNCIRSWIRLERASAEDRLRELAEVEKALEKVDFRADLDNYITIDKKLGGRSYLGDDDDGGIASALAILNSHSESGDSHSERVGLRSRNSVLDQNCSSEDEDDNTMTTEKLNKAVDELFHSNLPSQNPDAVEKSVDLLCKAAADISSAVSTRRAKRSAICYALNSKRTKAEITSKVQFDGLCRVFSSVLSGCCRDRSKGGGGSNSSVSNAKMCIMLASTFYMIDTESDVSHNNKLELSPVKVARRNRIYAKKCLTDHELWLNDDFWDEALSLQISEALTHSGVMSNFDNKKKTRSRETKWHDLNYTERIEAASQVHAIVFSQLSALAHSMMEFGCGLNRSCAFVRRMAIRNQLPSSQRTILIQHLLRKK